jgi:DNA uptake protein ComE-like DNA-binding protein
MKDRIKDYFAFNKKEQRGLIVLLVLMLLSGSANLFMPDILPQKHFDITPYRQEVEEFLASASNHDSVEAIKPQKFQNDLKRNNEPVLVSFLASPFHFDPNELKAEEWREMGMDEKIIRNMMRYREKGGKFRNKEGFRKIYGMTDSVYAILEPYIRISETETNSQPPEYNSKNHEYAYKDADRFNKYDTVSIMIELNSADSSALLDLNGIGPSYAGRIIKYRDRLGGFYIKEQLMEIKGMDSIRFSQFKNQVTIDSAFIRKIDLNTVAFKDLLKHPYFEYYLVKAIFQKKDEIKRFDSIAQIRSVPVMFEELYGKICPYLEVR